MAIASRAAAPVTAWIVAGWIWWAVTTGALALAWARARRRPAAPERPGPTSALLVRPCSGGETGLLGRLEATRPPPGTRVCFTVESAEDPAWPVCQAAARSLRQRGADAVALASATGGPNRKLAQITAAWATHGGGREVLLVMDSDVDPATVDISAILRATPTATPAMTWAPCVEAGGSTLADRASEAVLAGSWHAFALLARIDGATAVGKISAISARAVSACGGLGAFTHLLGEDAALAQAIIARGGSVTMLAQSCVAHVEGRSLAAVVARYSRWVSVVRAQRPSRLAGYPALLLATPLLLGISLATGGTAGASLATATLATRWCVALAARALSGGPRELSRSLFDPLLADPLLGMAFGSALAHRTVEWRGRRFRLRAGGRMVEVPGA